MTRGQGTQARNSILAHRLRLALAALVLALGAIGAVAPAHAAATASVVSTVASDDWPWEQ